MTHTSSLPTSVTYAATVARLAELRREAERHQRAVVARRRPTPSWPTKVAAALRDSVATALPARRGRGQAAACPTC